MSYYCGYYMTKGFYGQNNLKIICYVIGVLSSSFLFFGLWRKKNSDYLLYVVLGNTFIIWLNMFLFAIFAGFFKKDLDRNFLKRLCTVFFFFFLVIVHDLFFRATVQSIIFNSFRKNISNSVNIYKMFLLLYNMLYVNIADYFLNDFFRNIIYSDLLSMNMIIFLLKIVYTGVYSVKTYLWTNLHICKFQARQRNFKKVF